MVIQARRDVVFDVPRMVRQRTCDSFSEIASTVARNLLRGETNAHTIVSELISGTGEVKANQGTT
jgi:hypothetical protein